MPDANVKVICRFRPVNERERQEGDQTGVALLEFPDAHSVIVKPPKLPPQPYVFDNVFWNTQTTQRQIYEEAAKDTIEDVIQGFNGTIFAYGQTGAGKSFTMFGTNVVEESAKGIIPRACEHIFKYIAQDRTGTEFTIKCSFLEIYREIVRDLLDPERDNLKYVASVDDVIELLSMGEKSRAVTATKMNSVSSRSHSLFILTLTQKHPDGSSKEGKLNLADLAGSEKVGKTGASGDTLEEAKKINQSLSALGNCINALTKDKRGHVPYRDSKLTHILRESLGGNSKTTLLIACSPHSFNIEETISTLKFGQRAKAIKNKVKINAQRSVAELEAIIAKITKELSFFRAYAELLEKDIVARDAAYDVAGARLKIQALTGAAISKEDTTPISPGGDSSASATTEGEGSDGEAENRNNDTSSSTSDVSDYSPAKSASVDDLGAFADPSVAYAELQARFRTLRETNEERFTNLNDEIDKLEFEKSALEDKLKTAAEIIEKLEEEKAAMERNLDSQNEDNLKLSSLEHELRMKSIEIDSTTKELEKLREAASSVEEQTKALKDAQTRLTAEKTEILAERNRLQEQLQQAKAELSKAKEIEKENASLKEQIKNANASLESALETNAKVEQEVSDLKLQLESLELDLDGKNQENTILERALGDMKKRVMELEDESVKSGQPQEPDHSPEVEGEESKEKLQKLVATHRDQLDKIMAEMADATKKNIHLAGDIQRKDNEINGLKCHIEAQKATVDDTRKKLAETDTFLITLQERLAISMNSLSEEKETSRTYLEELEFRRKQMVDYEVKLRNILEEKDRVETEQRVRVQNAELQLEESQSRVKQLEMIVEDFRKKNTDLLDQLQGTIEAHKVTQEQLQEARDRAGDYSDGRTMKPRVSSNNIVVPQVLKGHSRATLSAHVSSPVKRSHITSPSTGSGGRPKLATNRSGLSALFSASDPREHVTYAESISKDLEKEGYLLYLGGSIFQSFQNRWVVLSGSTLYMYEEKSPKAKPKKFLDIEGAQVHAKKDLKPDEEHKWQLMLSRRDYDKVVIFAALSSGELNDWMKVIFKVASTTGTTPYFNVTPSPSQQPLSPNRQPGGTSSSVSTPKTPKSPSDVNTKKAAAANHK